MPRVLVVDDEADVRSLLSMVLELEGYDVAEAGDGAEALEALRRPGARFDAVVLDVMMPGISGRTVAREMRADAELASTPIIMLTALSDDGSVDVDVYLTKPVDLDVLRSELARLVTAATT